MTNPPEDTSPKTAPDAGVAPDTGVAPDAGAAAPGGFVARLAEQTRALVQDLTEWVDLRVRLVQLELQEEIEAKANEVARVGVMLVLGLVTLLFALVTLALGLGEWLGHPAWGFLAVTGLMALVTALIRVRKPRLVRLDRPTPPEPSPPALPDGTRKQLPKPPPAVEPS